MISENYATALVVLRANLILVLLGDDRLKLIFGVANLLLPLKDLSEYQVKHCLNILVQFGTALDEWRFKRLAH